MCDPNDPQAARLDLPELGLVECSEHPNANQPPSVGSSVGRPQLAPKAGAVSLADPTKPLYRPDETALQQRPAMRPPFPTMRAVHQMIEGVAITSRDRAESQRKMKKFEPDPNLPDDLSIHQVRLRPGIKRALAAAGLKTIGDVRKTSDAMLFSIQSLGWKSVMRLRIELGHRDSRELTTGGGLSPEQKAR
jgi:hypothetical protein